MTTAATRRTWARLIVGALLLAILTIAGLYTQSSNNDAAAAADPDLKIGTVINAGTGSNVPTSERLAGVKAEAFISGASIAELTTTLSGVQGTLYEEFGVTVPRNTPIVMCVTTPDGYEFEATIVNVGSSVADPEGQGRDCNEYTLTSQSAPTLVMVFDFTKDPDLKIGATIDAETGSNVPTSERLAGVKAEAFISGASIAELTTTLTGVQGTLYEEFGVTVPRNTPVVMCVETPEDYEFEATIVNVGSSVADPEGQGRDCNEYTLTSQSAPTLVMVFDFSKNPDLKVATMIDAEIGGNVPSTPRLAGVTAEAFIDGVSIAELTTALTGVQGTNYEEFGITVPRNTPVVMCVTEPTGYQVVGVIVNAGSPVADPEGQDRFCSTYTLTSQSAPTMVRIFDFVGDCDGLEPTIDMNAGDPGTGTSGDDVILGTPGDDLIQGLGGNDTICSLDGEDEVAGGLGDDRIFGGRDADYITGGADNDKIWGEHGHDELRGGDGDDVLRGNGGDDRMWGDDGDDVINGYNGEDTGWGGDGDDKVRGHDDDDILNGGPDNDEINGGDGADEGYGDGGDDFVKGSTGPDLLYGGSGSDELEGNGDEDTLYGGTGQDDLYGGGGNDMIFGEESADDLFGGGGGSDVCDGGASNDTADAACETLVSIP